MIRNVIFSVGTHSSTIFVLVRKTIITNIYNYLFTYLTICLICCHTCFNTKLLNGEMVSILFFGTRCGPGLVNKTAEKSLIKKCFCSTIIMHLSVFYYWSRFLISSTSCSSMFSFLDHGSCSRVHAALICSLFSSRSWFLFSCTCCSYLFSSRSWFLFSSTYCSNLFSFQDHGSCSRVHAALSCSQF